MIIDCKAPGFMWPEAVGTLAYIANRLRKWEDELSAAQDWRDDIGFPTPASESLGFLRSFYAKAHVTTPPNWRVQPAKMAPLAYIGHVVGYEGECGHIYRIDNLKSRKVTRERDIIFWEPP